MLLESQISSQPLAMRLILNFFHHSFLSRNAYDRDLGRDVINGRSTVAAIILTAEQAEILRFAKNGQMDPGTLQPCSVAMTFAMHCTRPRTEANCRCDVSFERPLITSRPRTRSYASRERKL